jgi:hypothetical protein
MAGLKPGTRMKSTVCATEVMVIQAPSGDVDLRCGGAPMQALGQAQPAGGARVSPAAAKGTALGKRYVDAAGTLELLCTKPGEGSLAVGEALLQLKEAKPLPSSD